MQAHLHVACSLYRDWRQEIHGEWQYSNLPEPGHSKCGLWTSRPALLGAGFKSADSQMGVPELHRPESAAFTRAAGDWRALPSWLADENFHADYSLRSTLFCLQPVRLSTIWASLPRGACRARLGCGISCREGRGGGGKAGCTRSSLLVLLEVLPASAPARLSLLREAP